MVCLIFEGIMTNGEFTYLDTILQFKQQFWEKDHLNRMVKKLTLDQIIQKSNEDEFEQE